LTASQALHLQVRTLEINLSIEGKKQEKLYSRAKVLKGVLLYQSIKTLARDMPRKRPRFWRKNLTMIAKTW
jgi:hypothetical protein